MKKRKKCPGCQKYLGFKKFSPNPARHDKLASHCYQCSRKNYKKYRKQMLENKKQYYIKNKSVLTVYKKQHYQDKKAYYDAQRQTPEYKAREKNNRLLREYGVDLKFFKNKIKSQNNKCAICKQILSKDVRHVHLDHCHKTGKVRDVLCRWCNIGLGKFKDSYQNLIKAAKYLKRHK